MGNSLNAAETASAWDAMRALYIARKTIMVKVYYLNKGGAITFVKGLRAFIPASQLSMGYVDEEKRKKYVGKTLTVQVIEADEKRNQLKLSHRWVLREIAYKEREKKIASVRCGEIRTGVVEAVCRHGAFIRVKKDISIYDRLAGWSSAGSSKYGFYS